MSSVSVIKIEESVTIEMKNFMPMAPTVFQAKPSCP
jgi:hypothetical protein